MFDLQEVRVPVHQHLDDSFLLERDLVNYWGYTTLGFFAPEPRYAANPEDPVTEFKGLRRSCPRAPRKRARCRSGSSASAEYLSTAQLATALTADSSKCPVRDQ